ncbi:hypothetical protein JG688_00010665, partial [Phytophthora aleatoria]
MMLRVLTWCALPASTTCIKIKFSRPSLRNMCPTGVSKTRIYWLLCTSFRRRDPSPSGLCNFFARRQ